MVMSFDATATPSTRSVTVAGPATVSVFVTLNEIVDLSPTLPGFTVSVPYDRTGRDATIPYHARTMKPAGVCATARVSIQPSQAVNGMVALPFGSVSVCTRSEEHTS